MAKNDEAGPLIPALPVHTWETDRIQEASAAQARGDLDEAERIRAHMVSEAETFGPEDAADLDEVGRAVLLFRRSRDATAAGRVEEGKALMEQLAASASQSTVATLVAGSLLQAGRGWGWLPEEDYDRLISFTASMGPEVAALVAEIQRGRPVDASRGN